MKLLITGGDGLITTSSYLTKNYQGRMLNIIELPTLYDQNLLNMGTPYLKEKKLKIRQILYAGNPFGLETNSNNRSNIKDRLDKVILLLSQSKKSFLLNIYGVNKNRYLEVFPEHKKLFKTA